MKYHIYTRPKNLGAGWKLFRGKDLLPEVFEANSPAEACKNNFDHVGPVFLSHRQQGTKDYPASTPSGELYAEEVIE